MNKLAFLTLLALGVQATEQDYLDKNQEFLDWLATVVSADDMPDQLVQETRFEDTVGFSSLNWDQKLYFITNHYQWKKDCVTSGLAEANICQDDYQTLLYQSRVENVPNWYTQIGLSELAQSSLDDDVNEIFYTKRIRAQLLMYTDYADADQFAAEKLSVGYDGMTTEQKNWYMEDVVTWRSSVSQFCTADEESRECVRANLYREKYIAFQVSSDSFLQATDQRTQRNSDWATESARQRTEWENQNSAKSSNVLKFTSFHGSTEESQPENVNDGNESTDFGFPVTKVEKVNFVGQFETSTIQGLRIYTAAKFQDALGLGGAKIWMNEQLCATIIADDVEEQAWIRVDCADPMTAFEVKLEFPSLAIVNVPMIQVIKSDTQDSAAIKTASVEADTAAKARVRTCEKDASGVRPECEENECCGTLETTPLEVCGQKDEVNFIYGTDPQPLFFLCIEGASTLAAASVAILSAYAMQI